jgi:hypothetical protein
MKKISKAGHSVGLLMAFCACAPIHSNTVPANSAKATSHKNVEPARAPSNHYLDHHQGHLSVSRPVR